MPKEASKPAVFVTVSDARLTMRALIERIRKEQLTVVLTAHGRPVAKLMPASSAPPPRRRLKVVLAPPRPRLEPEQP